MDKTEVTIIGAGIIGLAIAAELSKNQKHLLLIERHDSFGRETSSRNSEVLHAGIYYPPASLKAKTCVEGNRITYQICKNNNIKHRKTEKLIVGTGKKDEEALNLLFDNAKNNGLDTIELISKKKIKQLEPSVEADFALYSKTTGIVDTHSLMRYFEYITTRNGATICYNTQLKAITKKTSGYVLTVADNDGGGFDFYSDIIINCAGLESDTVARAAGMDVKKLGYELKYCKGQYFNISGLKTNTINRLIYPVPSGSAGLGTHITVNLSGQLRLGPDDNYVDRHNFDYNVNECAKQEFFKSVSRFLPFLKVDMLTPDTSGIRPKLQGEGEGFRDFIIKDESENGLRGFVNLIGIESPGITAAASVGKMVSQIINSLIG